MTWQDSSFSRRHAPEFCKKILAPSKERGRRECRMLDAPAATRAIKERRTRTHKVHRKQTAFPAQWFSRNAPSSGQDGHVTRSDLLYCTIIYFFKGTGQMSQFLIIGIMTCPSGNAVGWVEPLRETHHLAREKMMGFARAQPILRDQFASSSLFTTSISAR
jgi:hypothetical protein